MAEPPDELHCRLRDQRAIERGDHILAVVERICNSVVRLRATPRWGTILVHSGIFEIEHQ
jgi:hypothetical protein